MIKKGLIFILFLIVYSNMALTCTDFRIKATDKTVIIARSMEFAIDLNSNLRNCPRGRLFKELTPDGKSGLSWNTRYGYLYLDGLNFDVALDGINEEGLSFEALYLPGETQYQLIPRGHANQALSYIDIGHWILGNFKTVEEVSQALPQVFVYAQKLPGIGNIVFPLHYAIYDRTGKGIVVEYVGGKLNIYDNKLGVLTNSPTYDWHITNLRNYVNLRPINPSPIFISGLTFFATGQGAGMIGLPGDISPPSRFVKTAILLQVILPVDNAFDAINLAEHIINNVDIPLGLVREPKNGNVTFEKTQWVVFKDLTNKKLYYRTYDNMTLRSISLQKINFSNQSQLLKMPLESGTFSLDLTNQFLAQKSLPPS